MSVGLDDPVLAGRPSPGARGRMSSRAALKRILAGTGARFIEIDASTVRIAPAPRPPPRSPRRVPRPMVQAPSGPIVLPDIIVTASKQRTPLGRYAGTVSILDADSGTNPREASAGTASIVARMPVLVSTNLGPGRNKLFVRGIADSSFNGSSPATVGQYLGDVRLTYNAPDPNLNLYDMRRIEVLEGPQGTLYGTGALGGIIRLVPNPADLESNAGSLDFGGVAVAHGGQGYDAAGMLNLVLAPGWMAVRGVAYSSVEPGYIDDPSRGLSNINRTRSHGGRVEVRVKPDGGWTVLFGGAIQNISTRDGQYVLRGSPPLERQSTLSQPFDNDYGLAYLTASRPVGGAELTTTTSFVRHDVDTVFDATVDPAVPRLFDEQLGIRLFSHETRLQRTSDNESWIVGVSGLMARDRTERRLGDPAAPDPITGVRNVNSEVAAFGQYAHSIGHALTATVGGRLSYAHSSGDIIDDAQAEIDDPTRNQFRFSPTVALAWRIDGHFLAYVHAQSAFRPGLLEVAPSGAAGDSQRVKADTLSMVEAGLRFGERGRDRLVIDASASIARWTRIQSDLIDASGLPYTANVGDGEIAGVEAQASWQVAPALRIETAMFLNTSRLAHPAADFAAADERDLPNIPHFGVRAGASFHHDFDARTRLTIDGSVRYVGASQLGIGDPLDVRQGKYFDTSLGARLSRGAVGLSLDVSNLTDSRGNRFAFGNPFGIDQRNQVTPLVPRRVRLGVDMRF